MSPRTGAPRAGTRPARHDGGRHRQPRTTAKGGAATAKAGRKAAAAGLLGSAALTVPAAGLWASPSSVTLTHLNPRAYYVQALTGPGTQVRIYKYGKPVQRSASRSRSRRPAAAGRAGSPPDPPAGGVAGPTPSVTANRPADPGAVVLRPDGTLMRLAGGAHVVPSGSLLMLPGGQTISMRPGVYQSPFGVLVVDPGTGGTPASPNGASQATTGAAPGAPPGWMLPAGATGATWSTVFQAVTATPDQHGGMANPGAPIGQPQPGQQWRQPASAMTVVDSNGNLVGTVTSAGQLVSPAGVMLGTLRTGSGGIVTLSGTNGAVVGHLASNAATGAVTLVAAGAVATGNGAPPPPVTTSAGDPAPGTTDGAGGTPGTGTATATAARQTSEVFDVNGNLAGFMVGNRATGTVQLMGRAGSVLGTVQAGQAPGSLFVVGPAGTVHGQFGINPATGAVTLVAATSTTAPASPSPATGTSTVVGMPEASTATTPPTGQQKEMVVGDPSDPLA